MTTAPTRSVEPAFSAENDGDPDPGADCRLWRTECARRTGGQGVRRGGAGRPGDPAPPVLDPLPERADRPAPPLVRQRCRLADEIPDRRRLPPPREPEPERRPLGRVPAVPLEPAAVHVESNPAW